MTKIEIWGPVTWTFFHVMADKTSDNPKFIWDVFSTIKMICSALPCPECSEHATKFLSAFTPLHVNTRDKLRNILYVFHNSVNKRKHKPLFDYTYINVYSKRNVFNCFNYFKQVYNTKGNMNLINDSFRRDTILRNVEKWIFSNISHFIHILPVPQTVSPVPQTVSPVPQTVSPVPQTVSPVPQTVSPVPQTPTTQIEPVPILIEEELVFNINEESISEEEVVELKVPDQLELEQEIESEPEQEIESEPDLD